MFRNLDRVLISAVILLGLSQCYLLAKSLAHDAAGGPVGYSGTGLSVPIAIAPTPAYVPPGNGEITEITSDVLVLKNETGSPTGKEQRFKIGDKTEVQDQLPKDPKLYAEQQKAFEGQMQKGYQPGNMPTRPIPFEQKKIAISELKPGDRVTVYSDTAKPGEASTATRILRFSSLSHP